MVAIPETGSSALTEISDTPETGSRLEIISALWNWFSWLFEPGFKSLSLMLFKTEYQISNAMVSET